MYLLVTWTVRNNSYLVQGPGRVRPLFLPPTTPLFPRDFSTRYRTLPRPLRPLSPPVVEGLRPALETHMGNV